MTEQLKDDEFELYDLQIVVESIEGNCTCQMAEGSISMQIPFNHIPP